MQVNVNVSYAYLAKATQAPLTLASRLKEHQLLCPYRIKMSFNGTVIV